jgi:hypothetical protein
MDLWLHTQPKGVSSYVRPLSRYRSTIALVVAMAGKWQRLTVVTNCDSMHQ